MSNSKEGSNIWECVRLWAKEYLYNPMDDCYMACSPRVMEEQLIPELAKRIHTLIEARPETWILRERPSIKVLHQAVQAAINESLPVAEGRKP